MRVQLRGGRLLLIAGLLVAGARDGAAAPRVATHPGDLTVIQTTVSVNLARKAKLQRIRKHVAEPRPLPRGLARHVKGGLVVVAAAGELAPGTFVATVVVVNRLAQSSALYGGSAPDLETRYARAAVARLLGIGARGAGRSVVRAEARDLLTATPDASFCGGALPADEVMALTSPALHVEGAPIVPRSPAQILRYSLGLAFRACGLPLPGLLVPDDVDRFGEEIRLPPGGTTTTTLEEECDGMAALDERTLVDPAYPDCVDVEWPTPIPLCADDLTFTIVDVGTGQPIGDLLFGHTTLVTYFFGPTPIRLLVHACNREPGNPGGASVTLNGSILWGG